MTLLELLRQAQQQTPKLGAHLRSDGPFYRLIHALAATVSTASYAGRLAGAAEVAPAGVSIPGTGVITTVATVSFTAPADLPATGMQLDLEGWFCGIPAGATVVLSDIEVKVNAGAPAVVTVCREDVEGTEAALLSMLAIGPTVFAGDVVVVTLRGKSSANAVTIGLGALNGTDGWLVVKYTD